METGRTKFEKNALNSMSGAMGIRTPDLLHAMESRSVHGSPREFTAAPAELVIRSDRISSVHQSSVRTVTSLVTSPRHTWAWAADPGLFRIEVPRLARSLRQPARRGPGGAQCTPDGLDRTAGAHARRSR